MTDSSRDAKPPAHHVVLGLRVTGGFLGGAELEFADGLNCLIGGRGAGKTTALEFLRFGLGLMPDPKTNAQRHKVIDALVKANLGSGRLTIELRTKTDLRYTAGRAANETVQVLNEAGTAVPVSLDRDQMFSADVFSQNEVEEIASSPAAQLELLDLAGDSVGARIPRGSAAVHAAATTGAATCLREVSRHIAVPVQCMLWGRAAGRCQFAGCNHPLWKSSVTQEPVNIAEKAHIYSFSSEGPRGHDGVETINSIDNLILVCHQCHRKIDKYADGGRYTPELLAGMKADHEARIQRVGGVAASKGSDILLFGANVGDHSSPLN